MDSPEKKLMSYIAAAATARQALSQFRGMEISSMDIQSGLCARLNLKEKDHLELLDLDLTDSKIIDLLAGFDFRIFHPDVLATIELVDPLVPTNFPRLLTEQTIKVRGEVWRIHKNDADPFPSNPHAHNYEAGVVLHLGTGELFDRNRSSRGFIGKKGLTRLRNELKNITLPPVEP